MTSVSIVKEKESGTMEVLLVSPFSPFWVIVSKAVPYLALSLINLTVILLLSIFVLGMPVNGNLLLLYAVSTLFIITALSLGLLISNSTASQQAAMLVSLMGMLVPSILFTGFMFPLENMPYVLQLLANIIPAKWYYIIVKSVMIKGLGFEAIWKETLILLGMTVLLLVVNRKKFKIRLG
jgi:ABC-2 type transport system permease protein